MSCDQLIIIRHARTLTNIRQSESLDPSITEFGEGQATRVGKFLAKHVDLTGFSYYTSPFLRCLQTAERIMTEINAYGTNFQVRDEIREYINHCGREVKIPIRRDEFPDMYWYNIPEDNKEVSYRDEFNEELLNRLHKFCDIAAPNSLVVTHGLPALAMLHVVAHNANYMPIWDHSIDNCSMTYIVKKRVIWHGRNLYHEVDHDPFDKNRPYDVSDLLVPKV